MISELLTLQKLDEEELADFVSRAAVQLEPVLTRQLLSVVKELGEARASKIPFIRVLDNPMAKYQAVYIDKAGLVQQSLVNTETEGWVVISRYGNDECRKVARKYLKENE